MDKTELAGDRLGHLLADHLQAGAEGVAGAQRAHHQVEGVGQLLLELDEPPGAPAPHVEQRRAGRRGCHHSADRQWLVQQRRRGQQTSRAERR